VGRLRQDAGEKNCALKTKQLKSIAQQVFKSFGLNGHRADATFHFTSLRETSFNTGPLGAIA
jgi:hypothetical protein